MDEKKDLTTLFLTWVLDQWCITDDLISGQFPSYQNTEHPNGLWSIVPDFILSKKKGEERITDLHSLHHFLESHFAARGQSNSSKNERLIRFVISKIRNSCVHCVEQLEPLPEKVVNMRALRTPCTLDVAFQRTLEGITDQTGSPSPPKVAEQRYQYLGSLIDGFETLRKDIYNQYPKTRSFSSWPSSLHDGKVRFDGSKIFLHGKRYVVHWHPGAPTAIRSGLSIKLENLFSTGEYFYHVVKDNIRVIVCLSEPKLRRNYLEPIYWESQTLTAPTGEKIVVTLLNEKHVRESEGFVELEYITVRLLLIEIFSREKPDELLSKTTVYQCHYRNWQDGSIPFHLKMYKKFINIVSAAHLLSQDPTSPIAVHCSAGWGRSGVFIWCHSLIQNYYAHFPGYTDPNNPLTNVPNAKDLDIGITWRKLLGQRELIQNPFQLAFCAAWADLLSTSSQPTTVGELQVVNSFDDILNASFFNVDVTSQFIDVCYRLGAGWLSEDSNSPSWTPPLLPRWKEWFHQGVKEEAPLTKGKLLNDHMMYVWQNQLEKGLAPGEVESILYTSLAKVDLIILQDLLTYDKSDTKVEARRRLLVLHETGSSSSNSSSVGEFAPDLKRST